MTRRPAFGLALVVIAGSASLAFAWVGDLGLAMIAMSVAGIPAFLIGAAATTGVAKPYGTARHRKSVHTAPARPDADVAQYLNDDDRKWLAEFAPGWTAPTPKLAASHGNAAGDLQRIERELAALERKSADRRARDAFDDDGDLSEIVIVDASSGKPVRRYTRDGRPVRRGLDSATRQILLAQAAVLATRVDDEVSWLKVADQPLKQKRRRPRL